MDSSRRAPHSSSELRTITLSSSQFQMFLDQSSSHSNTCPCFGSTAVKRLALNLPARPTRRWHLLFPPRPGLGYGLSTQKRKNSGRRSVSLGFDKQRARGDEPARGCCCGGGAEAQPASTASSASARRARVTAGYHTSADATRL